MSEDPLLHLEVLKERNCELERRLTRLRELSGKLDENISKLQLMYEAMVTSQENQCIDMVQFDEEIRNLNKSLFPSVGPRQVTPRRREENSNLIMGHILALQRLDAKQCEEQLQSNDPLLKRVYQETRIMQKFISKYSSFL